jgi:hypothetical protein
MFDWFEPTNSQLIRLDSNVLISFLDVFHVIIFYDITHFLIEYVSANIINTCIITQQTFLISHYFKYISKFLPIISLYDSKSDLNSIIFYSTLTPRSDRARKFEY